MEKLHKIFFGILIIAVVVTGCDPLLDTNSDRQVLPANNQINSPNDTIYSMVGLFNGLNKLADRYVLLGELRGELMDVSAKADPDLKEIYNFDISQNNQYNKIDDYYSVINNCNYLINNIDTALVARAEKPLLKEYAAIKAIRAWTYMQLALNYGKAKYYTEPVLTVEDANKTYPEYDIYGLAEKLIPDLEPLQYVQQLSGFSLGEDLTSDQTYFPVKFVLGDLYLWSGRYEEAARVYHDLMVDRSLIISFFYRSTWTVDNGVFVSREWINQDWNSIFNLGNNEQITLIAGSTEYGEGSRLDSLTAYYNVLNPSQAAIDNWNKQTYYYNANVFTEGDLRGDLGSYYGPVSSSVFQALYQDQGMHMNINYNNEIIKYNYLTTSTTKAVIVYRRGLLYLRYAEAVNRAGKPNLAFAVLKNGLSPETMMVDSIVPKDEKYSSFTDSTGTFYDYADFGDVIFRNSIGVHERGCGDVHLANDYRIPASGSLDDSIQYVEDKIVEELALETAFEGNRFHDLMRVALRRHDPSYLANIVAEKYTVNKEAIRTKLMDENNWYLKP